MIIVTSDDECDEFTEFYCGLAISLTVMGLVYCMAATVTVLKVCWVEAENVSGNLNTTLDGNGI